MSRGGTVLLLARSAGVALEGVVLVVGPLRRDHHKSLHPRGVVTTGVLHRTGVAAGPVVEQTGAAWLDEAGTDPITVRLSRGAGLPDMLPDVLGLAVRLPAGADRWGDVLLAGTGTSPLARFVLRPGRRVERASYCSLMPYWTPTGPVLLGATPSGTDGFELRWARPVGRWHRFAVLELDRLPGADLIGPDPDVTFDPVLNLPPGLGAYAWTVALRERAYALSRRIRGGRQSGPDA